jgi:hypothetical protein
VTLRQTSRILGCSRSTIAHRLELIGKHCERFHRWRVSRARDRHLRSVAFQLDELETFEHSRRLAPVTMPVLVERRTFFIVDLKTAALPARGGLRAADRARKESRERLHGRRRSGSMKAVERCFEALDSVRSGKSPLRVQTDRKASYAAILNRRFGGDLLHERYPSGARRDYRNPLFPINHTLAMMRDGISRLVRRTWAASKLKQRLERHAWIWAVWRNYVRGITNQAYETSPAMALGLEDKKWRMSEVCAWKVHVAH